MAIKYLEKTSTINFKIMTREVFNTLMVNPTQDLEKDILYCAGLIFKVISKIDLASALKIFRVWDDCLNMTINK